MLIHFYKYQGTGNDFILIDNRIDPIPLSTAQIKQACDRHFGVGADGLMLLNLDSDADFNMVYYNSDGRESTMCGNGGRCMTAFAKRLGLIENETRFSAIDGLHEARIDENGVVSLKMKDVNAIQQSETYFELNTGSPHYVTYADFVQELDIKKEGQLIRYSPRYKDEGINVNFVERLDDKTLFVRTYERGVEDETLSCGTGVTAAAITGILTQLGPQVVDIKTLGGSLQVEINHVSQNQFQDIRLKGPAEFVFDGHISL